MQQKILSSLAVLIICAASARAGSRMFLLDDEDSLPRFRRDIPPQSSGVGAVVSPRVAGPPIFRPPSGGPIYSPVPPTDIDLAGAGSDSYGKGYGKPGKVGPVYTFVKTDPYAHVKWGVRHVVGKQYAGHH